jgi:hypothetical protein
VDQALMVAKLDATEIHDSMLHRDLYSLTAFGSRSLVQRCTYRAE